MRKPRAGACITGTVQLWWCLRIRIYWKWQSVHCLCKTQIKYRANGTAFVFPQMIVCLIGWLLLLLIWLLVVEAFIIIVVIIAIMMLTHPCGVTSFNKCCRICLFVYLLLAFTQSSAMPCVCVTRSVCLLHGGTHHTTHSHRQLADTGRGRQKNQAKFFPLTAGSSDVVCELAFCFARASVCM